MTCVPYNITYSSVIVSSKTDQLFACVKEAIQELSSDWYSLAIELDIKYGTRKVR